jgi:hypothetical protein
VFSIRKRIVCVGEANIRVGILFSEAKVSISGAVMFKCNTEGSQRENSMMCTIIALSYICRDSGYL